MTANEVPLWAVRLARWAETPDSVLDFGDAQLPAKVQRLVRAAFPAETSAQDTINATLARGPLTDWQRQFLADCVEAVAGPGPVPERDWWRARAYADETRVAEAMAQGKESEALLGHWQKLALKHERRTVETECALAKLRKQITAALEGEN